MTDLYYYYLKLPLKQWNLAWLLVKSHLATLYSNLVWSLSHFHHPLVFAILFQQLQKPCQGYFQGSGGGSEKDHWFLKIPKWQHKLVRKYMRGKLFFSFINNAAKTGSYDLKVLRDTEIKYVFHSKAFFHPFNNFQRGCLSAFNLWCNFTKQI